MGEIEASWSLTFQAGKLGWLEGKEDLKWRSDQLGLPVSKLTLQLVEGADLKAR